MISHRLQRRTARASSQGGFTLVELLVVIGIIAILAGVALGPITSGIKKAKQSSGLQQAHALGLAMYSYANDNQQLYPDDSGGDASKIAKALLAGGYVSDATIFFISGGTATKFSGAATTLLTGLSQSNISWDFAGNNGNGLSTTNYQYLPLLWSSIVGGTEPTLANAATASSALTAVPAAGNPFGTDGMAVFYINNSASFLTSKADATGVPTVTLIKATDNTGGSPATASVIQGGG